MASHSDLEISLSGYHVDSLAMVVLQLEEDVVSREQEECVFGYAVVLEEQVHWSLSVGTAVSLRVEDLAVSRGQLC